MSCMYKAQSLSKYQHGSSGAERIRPNIVWRGICALEVIPYRSDMHRGTMGRRQTKLDTYTNRALLTLPEQARQRRYQHHHLNSAEYAAGPPTPAQPNTTPAR